MKGMKHSKDYLIHPQTQSTSFIIIQPMTITTEQLEGLKQRYAEMIVDGLDMNDLITLAVDSIVENLKGYEIDDIKEEVIDLYDAQTWFDLNP